MGGQILVLVSTHSRAEAAARLAPALPPPLLVSTHSRAEAAAFNFCYRLSPLGVSTHSRAEAAASVCAKFAFVLIRFQHTAARRRLPPFPSKL